MRLRTIAALTFAACLLGAGPAHAATFTVTNTNTSGAGSLAQAIADANANGSAVTDAINFAITPLGGVKTIAMGDTSLPQITTPVTIDGYTQSGASANTKAFNAGDDAVLTVQLTADHTAIDLAASNSTIRGLAVSRGPTPSGGSSQEMLIDGSNNTISGNFIGLNPAGANPITSNETTGVGIELAGGNTGNTFGGTTAASRNVIAGRVGEGIRLANDYPATGSTNTTIRGNYIGTNPAGTAKPSNNPLMSAAVRVFDGNTGTTIQGNLLSGTDSGGVGGEGVWVEGTSRPPNTAPGTTTSSGTIQGNLIGTQRDGTSALPNTTGVYINDARTWLVGGTAAGEANTIAFNTYAGVEVAGPNNLDLGGDRNRITGNSIYGNTSLGIDLAQTNQIGRTPNDVSGNPVVQDSDAGPNEQQNFPVFTSASVAGGNATVSGTLPSRPNTTYRVEVFANGGSCAASTPGQGRTYLGAANVTTNASGTGTFSNVTFGNVPAGQTVIAGTATDPDGNTSEFSDCIAGSAAPPPPQCSDGLDNDGDGKTDLADPGCSSAADDSEAPDPASTGGGGGSAGGGTQATGSGASTAAPVTPSSFNALGSTQCSRRAISLIRADVRGKTIVLSGLVGAGLAKGKVTVKANYKVKGKTASTTVTADAKGQFSARLTRPSARGFAAARYTATSGTARSIQLRLTQSLATSSIRQAGANITLKGKVKKSLLGKRNPVVIKRLVCGTYRKVTSVKPAADGTYTATFSAQGIGGAALYRAESVVLARPHAHKYVIQYARAVSITLTGQTG